MRRVAALAVAALALCAAPAGAQTPIAGGGSFNDAPELAPGRYEDSLRGGEQLFYGVRLKPGQKLAAGVTVKGKADSSYFIELTVYSPLRVKDSGDGAQSETFGQQDTSKSLRIEGQQVAEQGGGTAEDVYAKPGLYYVSLNADDLGNDAAVDQFDTTLDLQVTGTVLEEPTPTPTPEAAATAEPDGGTAGLGAGGDGGGGELGLAIVLGLALGGLVGFGVRRLRTAG